MNKKQMVCGIALAVGLLAQGASLYGMLSGLSPEETKLFELMGMRSAITKAEGWLKKEAKLKREIEDNHSRLPSIPMTVLDTGCCVSLDDYQDSDEVAVLPCGHSLLSKSLEETEKAWRQDRRMGGRTLHRNRIVGRTVRVRDLRSCPCPICRKEIKFKIVDRYGRLKHSGGYPKEFVEGLRNLYKKFGGGIFCESEADLYMQRKHMRDSVGEEAARAIKAIKMLDSLTRHERTGHRIVVQMMWDLLNNRDVRNYQTSFLNVARAVLAQILLDIGYQGHNLVGTVINITRQYSANYVFNNASTMDMVRILFFLDTRSENIQELFNKLKGYMGRLG